MIEKLLSYIKWIVPFDYDPVAENEDSFLHAKRYRGEDVWVAAVSYIPFFSAAILLLRKNNSEFVLTHAKQSLILTIFTLLIYMLLPVVLKIILDLVLVLLMILSVYMALAGRKFYIPLVTELANLLEI